MGHGMPSARGIEWATDGKSRMKFDQGFDNIPRNPDGTMRIEPLIVTAVEQRPNISESCSACTLVNGCDASCANGSEQCRTRIGV